VAPWLAIFDLDGTLADSFPWFLGAMPAVADRFGFRRVAGPEEREALRGLGPREVLRRLEVPRWRLPAIARHVRRLKAEGAGAVPLFPGVPAMLRALSEAGVALALATSDSEANARVTLGAENAALIRHWGCGAPLLGKTRTLRRVLRAGGVAPEDAVFVGDEVRDAEAARAVGVAFAAVVWGYGAPEALRAQGPAFVFGGVAEIALGLLRPRPRYAAACE
jgi:phosphoglycolate phosphatase